MINRLIQKNIEKDLFQGKEKKKVLIIYGPRQVGKTTLVKYLIKKHPQKAEYFDCDYPDVRSSFSYENSHKLHSLVRGKKLIVLDEAQRIENIGLVLKILVDNFPELQVIATGSSSFELSNKISEPLTGRKIEYQLFPFSLKEIDGTKTEIEIKRNIDSYLRFGLYPDVVLQDESNAELALKELTASYLFKDVFSFQELRKPELLTKLLRLLAFQIGNEVSFHELAVQLGVDQTVIQKYIFLLEEAFVIFRIGALKRNLRKEVSKSRKIYFWDLGIRNALIQNFNQLEFRNDIGQLWENFCISERLKSLSNQKKFVNYYFWRTYDQKEIDYLEESGGKLHAYEFKWTEKKRFIFPKDFLRSYQNVKAEIISPGNIKNFLL